MLCEKLHSSALVFINATRPLHWPKETRQIRFLFGANDECMRINARHMTRLVHGHGLCHRSCIVAFLCSCQFFYNSFTQLRTNQKITLTMRVIFVNYIFILHNRFRLCVPVPVRCRSFRSFHFVAEIIIEWLFSWIYTSFFHATCYTLDLNGYLLYGLYNWYYSYSIGHKWV